MRVTSECLRLLGRTSFVLTLLIGSQAVSCYKPEVGAFICIDLGRPWPVAPNGKVISIYQALYLFFFFKILMLVRLRV